MVLSHGSRPIESIPPASDALRQHKIRYTLLSHKDNFLHDVLKQTHIIQNINTQNENKDMDSLH